MYTSRVAGAAPSRRGRSTVIVVREVTDRGTAHADQVRQRILEGAARAFARSGLQGTSVPDIAAECGVSVGLLYRYFTSKADLYTAICSVETKAEAEGLRQELELISDPRAWLEHAVDFYLGRLSGEGGAGLLLGAMAEAPVNEVVRSSLRLRRQVIVEFIESFIQARISPGSLPDGLPVASFSRAIAMLLDGVVVEWAVAGPDLDLAQVREAILALVTTLIAGAGRSQAPNPAVPSA